MALGELYLKDYQRCIGSLAEPTSQQPVTLDHVFPKISGKEHKQILGELVHNRRNWAPLCIPEHRRVDRVKIKEYREGGVSGLVSFIGEHYPQSPSEEILGVQRRQFAFLFSELAKTIQELNGDADRRFKEDYIKALDKSLKLSDRFSVHTLA